MYAVQFGAGNIGRGFLGQLFCEAGLEVVFVDVSEELVRRLNATGGYTVQIVGPGACDVPIHGVRALRASEADAVAEAVAGAEIACTAVGAGALPQVAPLLAEGIARRAAAWPLNVLLCENLHDAAGLLRGEVARHLPPAEQSRALAQTGFVQAVVSRMAPVQTDADRAADPLGIRVEAYKRLPVDASAIVGDLPAIPGVEPVSNFESHVERKLYTHNCAHAVLGYVGYAGGYVYGCEALQDTRIGALLTAVLAETSEALIRRHGFDRAEHDAHVADLRDRFANRALGDTCRRLARDPLRKLAPDDRLVGAARLCEAQDIAPRALSWAIAAALHYADPEDPSAVELQRRIAEVGRETVLRQVCGIRPEEPLAALIEEAYEAAFSVI